jgi:hypothetical protein
MPARTREEKVRGVDGKEKMGQKNSKTAPLPRGAREKINLR